MSVYIHIPFCVRKCLYCDFLSFPLCGERGKDVPAYIDALKSEIRERAASYPDRTIGSIFFGGGTPSVINGKYIKEIIDELKKYWQIAGDAELTLEVNPGTADGDKFRSGRKPE